MASLFNQHDGWFEPGICSYKEEILAPFDSTTRVKMMKQGYSKLIKLQITIYFNFFSPSWLLSLPSFHEHGLTHSSN